MLLVKNKVTHNILGTPDIFIVKETHVYKCKTCNTDYNLYIIDLTVNMITNIKKNFDDPNCIPVIICICGSELRLTNKIKDNDKQIALPVELFEIVKQETTEITI